MSDFSFLSACVFVLEIKSAVLKLNFLYSLVVLKTETEVNFNKFKFKHYAMPLNFASSWKIYNFMDIFLKYSLIVEIFQKSILLKIFWST